jgi:hypothetical protein
MGRLSRINVTQNYFRIAPSREALESTTDAWDELNARPDCKLCGFHSPFKEPVRVELKYAHLKEPLNNVGIVEVGIIRSDLLDLIGVDLFRDYFLLGDVYDTAKNLTARCLSYVGRRTIDIRGDTTSSFRWCQNCGNPVYIPHGDRYLLESDVLEELPLYEGHPSVVIFRADVMARVTAAAPEFQFVELPIRDEPLDGLPLDLRDARKDLVMNQWKPRKKRIRRGT